MCNVYDPKDDGQMVFKRVFTLSAFLGFPDNRGAQAMLWKASCFQKETDLQRDLVPMPLWVGYAARGYRAPRKGCA